MKKITLISTALVFFTACSGGGETPVETAADPIVTATPTPTPTPTPSPNPTPTPTPTPTPACTAAPIVANEPYSLVFKGCSVANVAEYYDKTECVRQNSTGLIWQGQSAAGTGLRANDQYKTNYDSIIGNQNYNAGMPIPATRAQIDASSNSIGFQNAVNATNLCGSGAWRLPTKDELLGIVKTSETPTIDNAWFPNTVNWFYWTSSPGAGNSYYAWDVNFRLGDAGLNVRYGYNGGGELVRLVR